MANEIDKWEAVRAKGKARFILVRGVLAWGLPMFVLMTFIVNRPTPNALLSPRNYVIFSVFLWGSAGALFGLFAWRQGESKYKKSVEQSADRPI